MLWWKKMERRFTDWLKRGFLYPVRADAGILVIALFMVLFFCLLLKASFDEKRMEVTYDSVDDAIVSALTSAATINMEEYGLGGQAVIYKTVTKVEAEEPLLPGQTPSPLTKEEQKAKLLTKAEDNLKALHLLQPVGDSYLKKSYDDFLRSLKRNLKLDANMVTSLSGIEGVVTINEFAIYNLFEQFDEDGNRLAYRIIKYSYNGSSWSAYPYNLNTPVSVYNSHDKVYTPIEATTVMASLSFKLRISDYNSEFMPALTEADMYTPITYQRLVDIKK